jgi:hypothetical protein
LLDSAFLPHVIEKSPSSAILGDDHQFLALFFLQKLQELRML